MGKCNLLTPLLSNTGTLYTFSQYAEDLTTMLSNVDDYRVTISRFMCLDLNKPNIEPTDEKTYDQIYGEIFQNYFENACSAFRDAEGTITSDSDNGEFIFRPEHTRTLLFETLVKYGMMSRGQNNEITGDEIKFINDINIISSSEHDNITYNEFYCTIPQQSSALRYKIASETVADDNDIALIYDIAPVDAKYPDGTLVDPSEFNDYIIGYPYAVDSQYNRYPTTGLSKNVEGYTDVTNTNQKCYSLFNDNSFDVFISDTYTELFDNGMQSDIASEDNGKLIEEPALIPVTDVDRFKFNAVIIFYDIVDHRENSTSNNQFNIPFGIYFTGHADENGEIENPVTVHIKNNDIYNQGTSYNLRVALRYLATQNATLIMDNIEIDNQPIDDFSSLYNMMAESQRIMRDNTNYIKSIQTSLSNHLAMFKNYRVNVPYIRTVNGVQYWFVNGRMLTPVTAVIINNYNVVDPDTPVDPENPDTPTPDEPDNPDPTVNVLRWLSLTDPENHSGIEWLGVEGSDEEGNDTPWEYDLTSNQDI